MSGIIQNISSGFWAQYPIGTRLDWAFIARQLNQNRIAIINAFLLLLSLFAGISRIWTVLAVPFLGLTNRDSLRQNIPTSSLAAKYTYLLIAYPLGNLLAVLGIIIAAALLIVVLITLPIIAAVVLVFWALVVFLLFLLWFTLYRYPVFEVINPRLRKRMIANNSDVYSKLLEDEPTIRVVRLKAGEAGDKIECELVSGPLPSMDFEALSYVWGVTLMPYTIQVDGKPFYITRNLHSALKALRLPRHDRLIWVDAMCINQNDNIEKGSQVQMMRDIYAKASRVVVWLGKDTKATSTTFALIRQFGAADTDARDILWETHIKAPHWNSIRREFDRMLEHEWFSRAWIIQEVALARYVVMQRGSHQVDWEDFHKLCTYRPFLDEEFRVFDTPVFVADIQEIRTEERANEPISNTLLGLAYRFRLQAATFGSDKIYALLGLLKAGNPSLIIPDYDKPSEDVFVQFTISCLEHNRNLTAIVLAAGTELQGVSWCRDWRFTHDGSFENSGLAVNPPPAQAYAASGTQPPIYQADIPRRILSLQGYVVDTVDRVGGFQQEHGPRSVDWDLGLRAWERVAGGLLSEDPESDSRKAFNRTMTADQWLNDPLDWRRRITARSKSVQSEEDKKYKKVVDRACINRRFFVTRNGRFGLGPWNMRRGDEACILFGGKTPFILRQCNARESKRGRADAREAEAKTYYKVIGEAFVDGLMYYKGSMEDDIKSGKVSMDWFHLL